jgi:thiamine biosynthesis lipoprotein
MAASGMRHVRLDAERRTVAFDVEGLGINLGSIGKGYAIDHAVRLLEKEHGVTTALMQGGSSSLLALGAPSGMPLGWRVGIENPLDRTQRLATVRLRDRALGTASAADQYFEVDGRRYGHILDPRTGVPAETDVISASAIARDAATADALATAFFVAGLDKTARFCQDHRDIGAVLVLRGDPQAAADEPLRVRTFNVPKEEIDLSPEPMVATRDTASLMGMASVGLEPMVTR